MRNKNKKFYLSTAIIVLITSIMSLSAQIYDIRNVINAQSEIPSKNYCDQPYIAVAKNGDWVCVMTTGPGRESKAGQHIAASISKDRGKTWSNPFDIEPSNPVDGLESSWAIPYVTKFGRIYVFYTYNGDSLTPKNTWLDKSIKLAYNFCEMGWFAYKYSDDNGQTWSKRYRIPIKEKTADYLNPWNGKVQLFWSICTPITVNNTMYFAYSKMAFHVQTMNEGFLIKSDNINFERDPLKINWSQLPESNIGICDPNMGVIQEEHNIVDLRNGDLYCVYRTQEGFPAESYSRDGGKTWSIPQFVRYADGRALKNPQACAKLFKTSEGKYLLWYHNNSAKGYTGARNPVWLSGGVEKRGKILWSQPEILLYRNDTSYAKISQGMSYPDFIEIDNKFWVTETQKSIARVHTIDNNLLNGLWKQGKQKSITKQGLIFEGKNLNKSQEINLSMNDLNNSGFTIDMWLTFDKLVPGQILFDNRSEKGIGFTIQVSDRRTLDLVLTDGKDRGYMEATQDKLLTPVHASFDMYQEKRLWSQKFNINETDPGLLYENLPQHVVFIVDGLSRVISNVVNGKLSDGGRYKLYGWNRISHDLTLKGKSEKLRIMPDFDGCINSIRIYDRYLTTSEAISNFSAGYSNKK
jgi:hypothetical protein